MRNYHFLPNGQDPRVRACVKESARERETMITMVMRKGCRCFFGVWLNLVGGITKKKEKRKKKRKGKKKHTSYA